MLTLGEMLIRISAAAVLGALIGVEREVAGKEAGVRTNILVASGTALFTIAGLSLPYIISPSSQIVAEVIARNSGFLSIIGNIVVGIGFLGTGIIVKDGVHVRGLTTAASVWFVAAAGILCGIGLLTLAAIATLGVAGIVFVLRKIDLFGILNKKEDARED